MVQPDAKQVDRRLLQVMLPPITKLMQASNTLGLESVKLHVRISFLFQVMLAKFFRIQRVPTSDLQLISLTGTQFREKARDWF
jgi:hypothetical protein